MPMQGAVVVMQISCAIALSNDMLSRLIVIIGVVV